MIRQSQLLRTILLFCWVTSLVGGCAQHNEQVETKTFPLSVIVAGPMGEAGATLPPELIELALPVQSEECKSIVFAPTTTVLRVDVDPPRPWVLKPQDDWTSSLQHFLRSPSTWEKQVQHVRRGLQKQPLPGDLAASAEDATRVRRQLKTILEERAGQSVLWLYDKGNNRAGGGGSVRSFPDFDTFHKEAAADLCGRLHQGQGLSEYVVGYAPGNSPGMIELAKALHNGTAEPKPALPETVGAKAAPPETVEPTVAPPSLAQIRRDLEEGRLAEAQRSVQVLRAGQPQHTEVAELAQEMQAPVQVRIVVHKPDGHGDNRVFSDATPISLPVGSGEREFRVQVEPRETVYVYLYGEYSDGSLVPLFSPGQGPDTAPLTDGRSYSFPSESTQYELRRGDARLTTLYTVASRWPARDLEQLNVRLAGGTDREAVRQVLQALRDRREAGLGGCDVRAAQFKLTDQVADSCQKTWRG